MQKEGATGKSDSVIRLLSKDVIHRIAAGEVVDRPASVLKELLDNSIDAGASAIKVIIADGGLKSIEIEDNGCGMSRADLEVCALRHATSKIQSLDDLDAIRSLGFRGEALAAVSSVAKLKIESAKADQDAWSLEILGGSNQIIQPAPTRRGTRIRVDELFFNVPARRKFLKSLGAELNECVECLTSVALAHPSIQFEWYAIDSSSGEVKKSAQWSPGNLTQRFHDVYGHEGEILYIDADNSSAPEILRAQVAVYRPPVASPYQKSIRLSVNGRPVQDKRLPYALREALAGLIEVGRYPILQANLDVDVHSVDVNIHPQKKEIRWPANFSLASYLYSILRPQFEVRPTLAAKSAPTEQSSFFDLATTASSPPPEPSPDESMQTSNPAPGLSMGWTTESVALEKPTEKPADNSSADFQPAFVKAAPPAANLDRRSSSNVGMDRWKTSTESQPPFRFSELRVIGESGASWILCESPRGLVIIDQHAAHERVNFERILCSDNLLRSKPLLIPIDVPADLKWEGFQSEFTKSLEALSFEFSDDGTQIIAVPEADRKINWAELIDSVCNELRNDFSPSNRLNLLKQRLAASLSCHGSVRRGQRLTHDEVRALLKSMDEVKWGGLCPHGRPVWIEVSDLAIEEAFHR